MKKKKLEGLWKAIIEKVKSSRSSGRRECCGIERKIARIKNGEKKYKTVLQDLCGDRGMKYKYMSCLFAWASFLTLLVSAGRYVDTSRRTLDPLNFVPGWILKEGA
jgi:hypothetical protein